MGVADDADADADVDVDAATTAVVVVFKLDGTVMLLDGERTGLVTTAVPVPVPVAAVTTAVTAVVFATLVDAATVDVEVPETRV